MSENRARFPPYNFPTVFVDLVSGFAHTTEIVKLYLARNEPSFAADGTSETQPVAQVVMPIDGFLRSVIFLEEAMKILINARIVSPERVTELRALFENIRR